MAPVLGRMIGFGRGRGRGGFGGGAGGGFAFGFSSRGGRGGKPRGERFWVDGLLPECEDQDLRAYFSQFGNVLEASVARERDTTLSRCFGSVSMADQQVTQEIFELEHKIWGCPVSLRDQPPADSEHPETHAPPKSALGQTAGRFYVWELHEETTEEHLREYFGKFGEVVQCIVAFEDTGAQSAQVKMADPDVVDTIIKEVPHEIKGQQIQIGKWLSRKPKPKTDEPKPMREENTEEAVDHGEIVQPQDGRQPKPAAVPGDIEANKFHMGNLPVAAGQDQVRSYFETFGTVAEVIMIRDKATGASKRCGFVSFVEVSDDLKKRLLEETHTMDDKELRISQARVRGGAKGGSDHSNVIGKDTGGTEGRQDPGLSAPATAVDLGPDGKTKGGTKDGSRRQFGGWRGGFAGGCGSFGGFDGGNWGDPNKGYGKGWGGGWGDQSLEDNRAEHQPQKRHHGSGWDNGNAYGLKGGVDRHWQQDGCFGGAGKGFGADGTYGGGQGDGGHWRSRPNYSKGGYGKA